MAPDVRLRAVPYRPDPARHHVIDCRPGVKAPYFIGQGDEQRLCGECGSVLIKGVVLAFLTLYLCCPDCGTYNVAEAAEDG